MTTRSPAVAGMFYPASASEIRRMLGRWLVTELTELPSAPDRPVPPALIVPHAGYVYSGSTAARAYARWLAMAELGAVIPAVRPEKVVLVGPTHRVPVRGVAFPTTTTWTTPLGDLPVWPGTAATLAHVPWAVANDATHRDEHALEVQLPFLQMVFGIENPPPIVPLNAGAATGAQVAEVIAALWNEQTLLVISSDLSHYLPYDVANRVDAVTIEQILNLDGPLDHEQACGATPINGVIEFAKQHGWHPELIAACNSGNTAGDKHRVVGYASFEFGDAA